MGELGPVDSPGRHLEGAWSVGFVLDSVIEIQHGSVTVKHLVDELGEPTRVQVGVELVGQGGVVLLKSGSHLVLNGDVKLVPETGRGESVQGIDDDVARIAVHDRDLNSLLVLE